MTEVIFITPEDARYGFSLAGSMQLTVTGEKVEELLCQTMADPNVGVVIIDERLVKTIETKRFSELEENWHGLLITLPAPKMGAEEEEDYLQNLIQRALGYHVRLQL